VIGVKVTLNVFDPPEAIFPGGVSEPAVYKTESAPVILILSTDKLSVLVFWMVYVRIRFPPEITFPKSVKFVRLGVTDPFVIVFPFPDMPVCNTAGLDMFLNTASVLLL